MSKFTIVLLLIALVAMTMAKPQDVSVIDGEHQIDIVGADEQVSVVDGDQQVNVVDPGNTVQPRNGARK